MHFEATFTVRYRSLMNVIVRQRTFICPVMVIDRWILVNIEPIKCANDHLSPQVA